MTLKRSTSALIVLGGILAAVALYLGFGIPIAEDARSINLAYDIGDFAQANGGRLPVHWEEFVHWYERGHKGRWDAEGLRSRFVLKWGLDLHGVTETSMVLRITDRGPVRNELGMNQVICRRAAVIRFLSSSVEDTQAESDSLKSVEAPIVWVMEKMESRDAVELGVSNPYPRQVLCRVAVEHWVSGVNWSIIHSNVGIKKYVPKWAVWTNMNPSETRHLLWPTNLTCVPMAVSNARFRAEFRETNLAHIADFTTAVVNVQEFLSSDRWKGQTP